MDSITYVASNAGATVRARPCGDDGELVYIEAIAGDRSQLLVTREQAQALYLSLAAVLDEQSEDFADEVTEVGA